MGDLSERIKALPPEKQALLLERLNQQTAKEPRVQIRRTNRTSNTFPLSLNQQRLWFLEQLQPGLPTYNIAFAVQLTGQLNASAMAKSLNEIVRRHDALRTTFAALDGQPVQVVAPKLTLNLPVVDLTDLAPGAREARVTQLAVEEAQRAFDLERGPLLRMTLVACTSTEHVMLLTMHHIISDDWSLEVFIREMAALYEAYVAGRPSPLAELPIHYADFACWEQEWVQGPALKDQLDYWKTQLAGAPAALDLPLDRPRPPIQTSHGAILSPRLPPPLRDGLRALSHREGASLFMTLFAAFNALLQRYTRQEDLLVGIDIANRHHVETEKLIGFLVNELVIRTDLSGNPTFRELLARVRRVMLEAYSHQDVPFDMLVKELQPQRDLSRQPLFDVLFGWHTAPPWPIELTNLTIRPFEFDSRIAKFDLSIIVIDRGEQLQLHGEFNTDLFDEATVSRMLRHYQALLESVVANPDQLLSEIPILTDTETHQLLVAWNDRPADVPHDRCFHQLFEAQVECNPHAPAAICADEQVSYSQLNQRANRMARVLVEQGVGADVVVALLAERGIDFLVTILAIFKAGGAYLPLDVYHPPERHSQILAQSNVRHVIAAREFMPALSQALERMRPQEPPSVLILEDLREQERADDNLPPRCAPGHLAYVIYTSGSTGQPKGAMVEQRGMLNHLYAKILDLQLTSRDAVAQTASQCFDISVWQFLAALRVGGRVHIFTDAVAHDPMRLLEQVTAQQISILETVPSLMRLMLDEVARRPARPELAALRWMIPTGEALSPDLCRQWFSYYPRIPLLNAYGPTECSDDVTHHPIAQPPARQVMNMPIGRPVANMRLYLLDAHLHPVPVGVPGEIYVGGIGVGRGYLHAPGRTAEAFIPDPFASQPGARLYRTGDLGRFRPNGEIEFLGRRDLQVKVHGHRIELGEIESTLMEHASVRAAVVLAREDVPNEKLLVAYVVPHDPPSVTGDELRAFLSQRLAHYMVPAAFVILEALPLTPNGKINRQALPPPDRLQSDRSGAYLEPQTEFERTIANLWRELLQVEKVGLDDNFFDLGGHSLLLIQVQSRLRDRCQKELAMMDLFKYPTVRSLAEYLSQAGETKTTSPDETRGRELQQGRRRLTRCGQRGNQ